MAKIRTILWDVGGVLLTNGWDHCERADLFRQFRMDRDDFERRHGEVNDAWEKSEITIHDYLDHTVFYEPRDFTREEFIARMKDMSQWLPHTAIGVVRTLAAEGEIEQIMLSNESRELMDHRIQKFGLEPYFSTFLVSSYIGIRKPDPKIFRVALDVTQTDPEETVFVDDRKENAAAASASELGIYGLYYEGPLQLEEELKRLGVKFGDRQPTGMES